MVDTRSDREIIDATRRGVFTMFMVGVSVTLLMFSYKMTEMGAGSWGKFILADMVSLIPAFAAIRWDLSHSNKKSKQFVEGKDIPSI
ncbi:MAG: hypothetical protein UU93_C0010G0030 [Candidatus Amesbacteria bacterium GW2011_GWA2_42_12]|uniref:Uncharacterized protein n=1 Tax=Candidatus Amesbacteria bacterium GW2011_GWA2_42_12 TaxID=1618356 RepID=A0A0G1ADE2_9BACT|nr:MAG: hypothetical protein UU93_C0010G0030 [Candidatus Amesbacteria bacterium GW2011_GWA2_42_12]